MPSITQYNWTIININNRDVRIYMLAYLNQNKKIYDKFYI